MLSAYNAPGTRLESGDGNNEDMLIIKRMRQLSISSELTWAQ